ncbi:hypothetical protein CMO96_01560, partial [Candidatus Woesebacteria bacterium]|nr:hypothetical protein [Candidatus Woesebacteria bacterium]
MRGVERGFIDLPESTEGLERKGGISLQFACLFEELEDRGLIKAVEQSIGIAVPRPEPVYFGSDFLSPGRNWFLQNSGVGSNSKPWSVYACIEGDSPFDNSRLRV